MKRLLFALIIIVLPSLCAAEPSAISVFASGGDVKTFTSADLEILAQLGTDIRSLKYHTVQFYDEEYDDRING